MSHTCRTRSWLTVVAVGLAAAAVLGSPPAQAAAAPTFHLPFPCDEIWMAKTYGGHARAGNPDEAAVDLKHQSGSSHGRTVIASAPGRVSKVVDIYTGSGGSGYGNHVIIDHGGGWTSINAHLDTVTVAEGDPTRPGTKIGTVGFTGTTDDGYGNPFAHVHHEQQLNGTPQPVKFNGSAWTKTYSWAAETSSNCKMWNAAGHLVDGTVLTGNVLGRGAGHVDFNGNKKSDAIRLTGSDWKVRYDGTGSWSDLVVGASATLDHGLGFGDFNGDGKTDIFQATGTEFRVRYEGVGAWQTLSSTSATMRNIGFGDFNGDGKTDVFRANNGVWDVRYGGAGSWTTLISSTTDDMHRLALADFNGDGKTDVMKTTGTDWKVRYGGTGSWATLATDPRDLRQLNFGHFNADKKADIFQANGAEFRVRYGGSGSWTTLSSSTVEAHKIALGDLNGDGKTDVLRATNADEWEIRYGGAGAWTVLSGSSFKLDDFIIG